MIRSKEPSTQKRVPKAMSTSKRSAARLAWILQRRFTDQDKAELETMRERSQDQQDQSKERSVLRRARRSGRRGLPLVSR